MVRFFVRLAVIALLAFSGCLFSPRGNEEPLANQPVLIAGKGIVTKLTYENGRVRCGFTPKGDYRYDVQCRAVVAQDEGTEYSPTEIEEGLQLKWLPEEVNGVDARSLVCRDEANPVLRNCEITLGDGLAATLNFRLQFRLADKSRAEADKIYLPYSVETFGAVDPIPYTFTNLTRSSDNFLASSEQIGYRNPALAALGTTLGQVKSVCMKGDTVFAAVGHYVYALKEGNLTVYVGSANSGNRARYDDRLRIFLGADNGADISLACGKSGLFIADYHNARIIKVAYDGTPSLIAAQPQLTGPRGMVEAEDGNLYIADTNSLRVLKRTPAGRFTTLFQGSGFGFWGIALAPGGSLLLTSHQSQGHLFSLSLAVNQPRLTRLSSTPMEFPMEITLDKAGNSYVADLSRIVRVSATGQSEVIYSSAASGITSVFLQDSGRLLFSELTTLYVHTGNGLIRALHTTGPLQGTAHTVAGRTELAPPGPEIVEDARKVRFGQPWDVAIAPDGSIFVADIEQGNLRQIYEDAGGNKLARVILQNLKGPHGLAFTPDGDLIIADTYSCRILKRSPNGDVVQIAGNGACAAESGDGGDPLAASLSFPQEVATDAQGNIYFVEGMSMYRVRKIGPRSGDGKIVITTISGGDYSSAPVQENILAVNARFQSPKGIAVDSAGNIFISDSGKNRIRKIDAVTGRIYTIVGNDEAARPEDRVLGQRSSGLSFRLKEPDHIDVDSSGKIYVTEAANTRIVVAEPSAGGYEAYALAGDQSPRDCGSGAIKGIATNGTTLEKLRGSLSTLCMGQARGVSVREFCDAPFPHVKLVYSQLFDENRGVARSNIVQVEHSCAAR